MIVVLRDVRTMSLWSVLVMIITGLTTTAVYGQHITDSSGNLLTSFTYELLAYDRDSLPAYWSLLERYRKGFDRTVAIAEIRSMIESAVVDSNDPHVQYLVAINHNAKTKWTDCVEPGYEFYKGMSVGEYLQLEKSMLLGFLDDCIDLPDDDPDDNEQWSWPVCIEGFIVDNKAFSHVLPQWLFAQPTSISQFAFEVFQEVIERVDPDIRYDLWSAMCDDAMQIQKPYIGFFNYDWSEFAFYGIVDSAHAVVIKDALNQRYAVVKSGTDVSSGGDHGGYVNPQFNECAKQLLELEQSYLNRLLDEIIYSNGIVIIGQHT